MEVLKMFGKKKKTPELAKSHATELGDLVSRQAGEWADLLGRTFSSASDSAKVYKDKAAKEANIYASKAGKSAKKLKGQAAHWAEEGAAWAAPKFNDAKDRVRPYIDDASHKISDDYWVRLQAAYEAAREEATKGGDFKSRSKAVADATSKALTTPPKQEKRNSALKSLGWLAVGASVAGLGYLVWKRNQPVEDPWAEAYWEDVAAEDAAAAEAAATEATVADEHVAKAEDLPGTVGNPLQAEPVDPVVDPIPEPAVDEPVLDEADAAAAAGLDTETDKK